MIAWIALFACSTTPTEPPAPAAAAEAPTYDHFGAPFTVDEVLPAATVLADPAAHAAGPVRMTAELTQVCQKAGCWAVVRDDSGRSIRLTMKDHAFGIAKDGAGKVCDVEGQLVSKEVDQATLDHYASEGGEEHPEAGKAEAYELVATAVAIPR